jgi:hypothetical protein
VPSFVSFVLSRAWPHDLTSCCIRQQQYLKDPRDFVALANYNIMFVLQLASQAIQKQCPVRIRLKFN